MTTRAAFLWASPSIEDCLGYTPEEIVNVSPYDLIVQDDVPSSQTAHTENLLNDMVATQATARYRHKDGSTVPILAIFSVCYEFMVACISPLDPDGTPCMCANLSLLTFERGLALWELPKVL